MRLIAALFAALLGLILVARHAAADHLTPAQTMRLALVHTFDPKGPPMIGGGGRASGPWTFVSTAPAVYQTALFGQQNGILNGVSNAGLKTNGAAAGAFYVPSTITNSWFFIVAGTIDPGLSITSPSQVEALASGQANNTGTGCSASACTGGSDHVLKIIPPANGATELAFQFQSFRSGIKFWQSGTAITETFTGGSGYNNGYYAWTLTGSTCTVAPSGTVTAGTNSSGVIAAIHVTNPGQGCPTSGTATVTASMASGLGGTGAATIATLTYGYGPGVTASAPGKNFCMVVGQYGADAPSALQNYPFMSAVDDSGNEFGNSPALSTVANATYYASTTQSAIGDLFNFFGSANASSTTANAYGWGGNIEFAGMVWGVYPNTGTAPSDLALQNLCTKAVDPYTYLSSNYTLHSFFEFGSSYSDRTGNNAAAVAVGAIGTGAPSMQGTALTLKNWGDYTIFPVQNATGGYAPPLTGAGAIPLSGTYNPVTLGGTPNQMQAQISTSAASCVAISGYASGCNWVTLNASTVANGAWSGSLAGVPAGGPYFVTVAPANAPAFQVRSGPVQVGVVTLVVGQSQMSTMGLDSYTGDTVILPSGLTDIGLSALEISVANTPTYLPEWSFANFSTYSVVTPRQLNSLTVSGTSASLAGDGFSDYLLSLGKLAAAAWTSCGSVCPVALVDLANPGKEVAIWDNGYVAQNATLTGSGASYSGAASFSEGSLGIGAALANTSSLPAYTVLAGSMNFYVGGVLAASDAGNGAFGVNTSTNCVGHNGFTVASCSINYLTGAVSISFGASTSSAVTVSWTNIIDLAFNATNSNQTVQYDGLDFVGNGAPASGFVSYVMARVPGANLIAGSQCTANEYQFVASYSAGAGSLSSQWSYVLGTHLPALFPQIAANTPVLWLGHMRDNAFPLQATNLTQINGCVQQTLDFATGASSSSLKYSGAGAIGYGGSEYDGTVYSESTSSDNPHPGSGAFGGQRYARRWALAAWGLLSNNPSLSAEPTVSGAAFDNTATYNSACSATHYKCLNINVALNNPSATALKTCGANLAGGLFPAAGTCTDAGIGEQVAGFRIGSTTTPSYSAGATYNDGFDPFALTFTQANGFSCTLVTSAVVQCVKQSGTWTSGATYVTYADQAFTERAGTLMGPPGASAGLTVTTAGTCTGSGTAHVSLTGGTFTTAAQVTVTYTTAGIQSVYPYTPGGNYSVAPTAMGAVSGCTGSSVTMPALCSGAAQATIPCIATPTSDQNIMGQALYDNSAVNSATIGGILGGGGAATSPCALASGSYCEYGFPVTPAGVETAISVSG